MNHNFLIINIMIHHTFYQMCNCTHYYITIIDWLSKSIKKNTVFVPLKYSISFLKFFILALKTFKDFDSHSQNYSFPFKFYLFPKKIWLLLSKNFIIARKNLTSLLNSNFSFWKSRSNPHLCFFSFFHTSFLQIQIEASK